NPVELSASEPAGQRSTFLFLLLSSGIPKVEVEPGVESVLLPCRTTENLDGDVKVEWRDEYDDVVHVYQNGSDQSEEQNQIYRTRTKMDENLLENKDLSLTLKYPADSGLFTCRVYSRDGEILMEKQVQLKVKGEFPAIQILNPSRFPLAAKQPQSIILPPPCLTVGMVFLGLKASPFLLQTYCWVLWPNSSIFVSSDHRTFLQKVLSLSM
uniref:Ig-like domain-containing protein n=1 Tax=Xiphophorus maculatus TaxID=8083 RepID=A0A3B5R4F5_XIPMA